MGRWEGGKVGGARKEGWEVGGRWEGGRVGGGREVGRWEGGRVGRWEALYRGYIGVILGYWKRTWKLLLVQFPFVSTMFSLTGTSLSKTGLAPPAFSQVSCML